MTGKVGQPGDALHQLDAAGPRQQQRSISGSSSTTTMRVASRLLRARDDPGMAAGSSATGTGEDEPGALSEPGALGPDAPNPSRPRVPSPPPTSAYFGTGTEAARKARPGPRPTRRWRRGRRRAPRRRDGGRLRRVPGRVREEVVQHLDDAPLVGHHPRQVRREVDADGLAAAAAHEGGPGPVDQGGNLRRLGVDRQRARVDAPRLEEVADEAVPVPATRGRAGRSGSQRRCCWAVASPRGCWRWCLGGL